MMSCVIAIPEPTINKIAEQFIDNCGNVNVVKSDEQFIGDTCGWAVTYTFTVMTIVAIILILWLSHFQVAILFQY